MSEEEINKEMLRCSLCNGEMPNGTCCCKHGKGLLSNNDGVIKDLDTK